MEIKTRYAIGIDGKLRSLRIQKNLMQEKLGGRADLSRGYVSQSERDLSSPSMETFFSTLEVLGVTPEQFFSQQPFEQKIVYNEGESILYCDEEHGYELKWLVPVSDEKEMEPIIITLGKNGEYRTFEPSLSEVFIYVIDGSIRLALGEATYVAKKSQTMYYQATEPHQVSNNGRGESRALIVATESYL